MRRYFTRFASRPNDRNVLPPMIVTIVLEFIVPRSLELDISRTH